jgi:hypothetical protein
MDIFPQTRIKDVSKIIARQSQAPDLLNRVKQLPRCRSCAIGGLKSHEPQGWLRVVAHFNLPCSQLSVHAVVITSMYREWVSISHKQRDGLDDETNKKDIRVPSVSAAAE